MPSDHADERRSQIATETVDATDEATAKWMLRITAGGAVDEAVRGAFIDGVSYGLNTLARLSGRHPDA